MVAQENLHLAVQENLAIHRFGAAASAYRTLIRVHSRTGNRRLAGEVGQEAARLLAASGQRVEAQQMLVELAQAGLESVQLDRVAQEIERSYAAFEASVEQLEQAADCERLFNHYRSKGDNNSALCLQLQANRSLSKVSQRAMYRRTPDVVAVLYDSLTDIAQAKGYLAQAQETFVTAGRGDLSERAGDFGGKRNDSGRVFQHRGLVVPAGVPWVGPGVGPGVVIH